MRILAPCWDGLHVIEMKQGIIGATESGWFLHGNDL